MTARPDNKNVKQPVTFTRNSAERISKTVRRVEQAARPGGVLSFGPRLPPDIAKAGDIFRTARFTGTWSVDSTTTIEFTNSTFTPQTATAINLFCRIIAPSDVGVARDIEDKWHLISWEMQEVCTTRIIDIQVELNTTNCEIYRTLVTSTMKFLQLTYEVATCSTATTPG